MDDGADKKRKLEMTVASLRKRWGTRVIGRLHPEDPGSVPHVPTGFPALDEALGIGGLPRGRISEISGAPTSGMATIALKVMANAQEQAGPAIYIDLDQAFDPDYAARCGLRLDRLVLVRPADARQGLAITQDFILNGGASILVFDLPLNQVSQQQAAHSLDSGLGRLIAPLSRSGCVLLFLTPQLPLDPSSPAHPIISTPDRSPGASSLAHYASIRLAIRRERWIYKQRDIGGYQAQVKVVKNKLGLAGKQVGIAITFNGTVNGANGAAANYEGNDG